MSNNFQLGQRVVFVPKQNLTEYEAAQKAKWIEAGMTLPVKGPVYTIRAIRTGFNHQDGNVPVLHLVEIVNRKLLLASGKVAEPGFSFQNFRPVVERKTSIEVFRAMLNPSKQTVEA